MTPVSQRNPRTSGKAARFAGLSLVVLALFLFINLFAAAPPAVRAAAGSPICYIMADSSATSKNASFDDVLALVDVVTGQATFIGQTEGEDDIEAIEFDEDGGELYGIDDSRLGIINQTNGNFTNLGELGVCNVDFDGGGVDLTFTIDDADGLAKDYSTGDWYGVARRDTNPPQPDYLFKFSLDGNGNPVVPINPNGFGTGVSCASINTLNYPGNPDLVDDIGFDPVTGQMYGVANGGSTTPTRIIAINKATGVPTDLGQAQNQAGVFIPDIEGFSIDEDGTWLFTTGQDGQSPTTDDSLFIVPNPPGPSGPPATIPAVRRAQMRGAGTLFNGNDDEFDINTSYEDWEAVTCYTVSDVTASIGDYTWLDQNGDGLQTPGEPAAPGITVTLYGSTDGVVGNGDDWIVGTVTTDANGFYNFPVPPGNYFLEFDPTKTYTTQNAGSDPAIDSDPNPATGRTVMTTLVPGENDPTWDAGLVAATVGNFVWLDANSNGVQDPGEAGVPGVEVAIYAVGDTPGVDPAIATTVTNAAGTYGFTVAPGDYFLVFDPTLSYTLQNAGGDDALDSDVPAGVGSGQTANFNLSAGENDDTWDAGLQPARIGDFVWVDTNKNGQQDPGEPGYPNVLVQLVDPGDDGIAGTFDDQVVDSMTTGNDGAYGFDVVPGDYFVIFNLPGAAEFTTPNTGPDATDSDAVPDGGNAQLGRSQIVTVAPGDENLTIDAGLDPETTAITLGDFSAAAPSFRPLAALAALVLLALTAVFAVARRRTAVPLA